jgi:hypothetical protein
MIMHLWIKYFLEEAFLDLCRSKAIHLPDGWAARIPIKATSPLLPETASFSLGSKMRYLLNRLFQIVLLTGVTSVIGAGWEFVQNGTSGIVALEAIVVSPTLAIFFDRASSDPLVIDGHSAWGAFWNFQTNTASPLRTITDTFCGSGGFLSNGTMVCHSE